MIDLATVALSISGPADVCIWTWSIAEYEVNVLAKFIADREILNFRLIMEEQSAAKGGNISDRKHTRGNLIADMQDRFGADCVRLVKNHAKIIMIDNADWHIAIRGSMNLNLNPRFEQFDISDDKAIFDTLSAVVDEIWEKGKRVDLQRNTQREAKRLFRDVGQLTLIDGDLPEDWFEAMELYEDLLKDF
jgi:hypothetical protein